MGGTHRKKVVPRNPLFSEPLRSSVFTFRARYYKVGALVLPDSLIGNWLVIQAYEVPPACLVDLEGCNRAGVNMHTRVERIMPLAKRLDEDTGWGLMRDNRHDGVRLGPEPFKQFADGAAEPGPLRGAVFRHTGPVGLRHRRWYSEVRPSLRQLAPGRQRRWARSKWIVMMLVYRRPKLPRRGGPYPDSLSRLQTTAVRAGKDVINTAVDQHLCYRSTLPAPQVGKTAVDCLGQSCIDLTLAVAYEIDSHCS